MSDITTAWLIHRVCCCDSLRLHCGKPTQVIAMGSVSDDVPLTVCVVCDDLEEYRMATGECPHSHMACPEVHQ